MAGEKHVILLKTKLHINIFQRFFQNLILFVYKALGYIIILQNSVNGCFFYFEIKKIESSEAAKIFFWIL